MKRLSPAPLWTGAILLLALGLYSLWPPLVAAPGPPPSPAAAAVVTLLDGTLAPLVGQFNQDTGKPRVLALLSPT